MAQSNTLFLSTFLQPQISPNHGYIIRSQLLLKTRLFTCENNIIKSHGKWPTISLCQIEFEPIDISNTRSLFYSFSYIAQNDNNDHVTSLICRQTFHNYFALDRHVYTLATFCKLDQKKGTYYSSVLKLSAMYDVEKNQIIKIYHTQFYFP